MLGVLAWSSSVPAFPLDAPVLPFHAYNRCIFTKIQTKNFVQFFPPFSIFDNEISIQFNIHYLTFSLLIIKRILNKIQSKKNLQPSMSFNCFGRHFRNDEALRRRVNDVPQFVKAVGQIEMLRSRPVWFDYQVAFFRYVVPHLFGQFFTDRLRDPFGTGQVKADFSFGWNRIHILSSRTAATGITDFNFVWWNG